MATGYPTPDAQEGDVTFGCIPIVVPNNPEFNAAFAAAIYGLYSSMAKPYFWRTLGTLSPELAAEYASRGLAQTEAYEECGDDCSGELSPSHQIITYEPQDPHTEPDLIPDGYLMPPFWVFGEVLPEFITDWFGGLIEELTGYNLTDVLLTIGSFPILADWFDIADFALPQIAIETSGIGEIEIHLLAVPFGGRALITLDEQPSLADIVSGLWNDSDSMVDTVLDVTSIPPETATEIIIERSVTEAGTHTFYVTFIPVVDDELIPLGFGGGLRSVVWCGDILPECEECPPEPTIQELIVEGDTFETEYAPAVFGEYWSETVANEAVKATAYDGTPQSIAPRAPTGVPNSVEKNALCAAVNSFVGLYTSTKLCLIQSKNFVEVFWNNLANAINQFYDAVTSLMSPIYSPNIFSCFVDDSAAITALQDSAAIEELACFLYEGLKTVTMSQANFDSAITDAATTLTGNAQKIACIMENDNSLSVYINMLESYNVQLNRQANSDDVECPCETDTYWMLLQDFSVSNQGWRMLDNSAQYTSGAWRNKTTNPPNNAFTRILKNFDRPYVVKASGIIYSGIGYTGVGGDALRHAGKTELDDYGTEVLTGTLSFISGTQTNALNEEYSLANTTAMQSYYFRNDNSGTPSVSNTSEINKVVLYGLPNAGQKPPGSVWVSAIPSAGNLFP